jgi:hypothetical protein
MAFRPRIFIFGLQAGDLFLLATCFFFFGLQAGDLLLQLAHMFPARQADMTGIRNVSCNPLGVISK